MTALLAAGCSAPTGAASPAGSPTAGTRTVESVAGPVEVPASVNSVVATEGRRDLDIALALGLPLVGFPRDGETPDAVPRFDAELRAAEAAGAEQLFLRNEINLEAIAAVDPDLVLGRDEDLAELPELTQIAAVLPLGQTGTNRTWQDDLAVVAQATGTQAAAEEVLTRYAGRLEEVRAAHADALGARVLMAATSEDGGLSLSGSRLAVRVLSDLGAVFSPAMAAVVPDGEADYSQENVARATADADLVVLVANDAEARDLVASPTYRDVPALAAGRYVVVDKYVNEGGPLTAVSFLDTLDELYAAL